MEITIRKATPEDAYNYTDCGIASWRSAYKGIVPDQYLDSMLSERDQRVEKYREALTNPGNCEYYCAMYAEKMIGFLIIDKIHAEIWAIYLVEEFWGKGYGKAMLDFAITELQRIAPKEISLWVFEENKKARRFYEKNHFHFIGTKRESAKYGKPLVQLKYVLDADFLACISLSMISNR